MRLLVKDEWIVTQSGACRFARGRRIRHANSCIRTKSGCEGAGCSRAELQGRRAAARCRSARPGSRRARIVGDTFGFTLLSRELAVEAFDFRAAAQPIPGRSQRI